MDQFLLLSCITSRFEVWTCSLLLDSNTYYTVLAKRICKILLSFLASKHTKLQQTLHIYIIDIDTRPKYFKIPTPFGKLTLHGTIVVIKSALFLRKNWRILKNFDIFWCLPDLVFESKITNTPQVVISPFWGLLWI